MNLWEELGRAALDVKKNPVLIVPILLQMMASIVLAFVFLLLGVFFVTAANGKAFTFGTSLEVAAMQPSSWVIGGILFLVFMLVMLVVNAFFTTGFFAMAKEAALGKTKWLSFGRGIKELFKGYLAFVFLYALLFVVLLIPMLIAGVVLYFIPPVGALILLFAIAFLVLGGLVLWVALFFVPPIMFTHKLDAITAMKESWAFLIKNFAFTLGTIGITLLVSIGVSVIFSLLLMPLESLSATGPVWLAWLNNFLSLITTLAQLIVTIIIIVFMFRAYNARLKETTKKA